MFYDIEWFFMCVKTEAVGSQGVSVKVYLLDKTYSSGKKSQEVKTVKLDPVQSDKSWI